MVKNVTQKLLKLILQYQQHILSTHSFVYLCQLFSIIFTFNPTFQPVFTLFVRSIESFTLDSNVAIFFISFLVLTLQLVSNISFVRAIYIPVFYIFSTNICAINILSIIICTIALIIDIIKNTFRIFTILNLESQPCNQIKAALCILNIIILFLPKRFFYFTISLTVFYFIVLLLRIKNPVSLKSLQILEQLWCVMAIVSLIFRCIINKDIQVGLWVNILATLFVIIGYIILRILTIQNKLIKLKSHKEQLIKNNQFLPAMQCIFQYLIGSYWQTETINLIEQFLYNEQQLSSTDIISIRNKEQYLLKLFNIAIEHKGDYDNEYQYWSLLYQLQSLSRHNIPSMVIILEIIKKISQQYFIIRYYFRWLEINKLQQILQNKIQLINQIQQKQYKYKQQIRMFEANDRFVEKIRQTTQLFISVWNLLRQKCTINFKIDQLIRNKDQIHQMYQQLGGNKSKMSTKTYMDYLYYVEKNIDQYYKIYDDFTMSYFPQIDQNIFKLGIYIVFSLQGEIIQITNSNLLGYEKQQLEKHTVDVLLPNFIKHVHHNWMSKYFDSIQNQHQLQKITRFNKSTFCVNKEGNLKQIDIKLGLCMIDNSVRMAGVVKVIDNKCIAYNKQTHRIVGSSEALNMVSSNHDVISSVKHDISIYQNQFRQCYQNQSKFDQMKIVTSIQNLQQNQQFILFKKIIVDKQEIWILINNPNTCLTKYILQSNNLVSPPKSKQFVLINSYKRLNRQISPKTKQFIHKKQQLQNSTYPLKYFITKFAIIFFLFCVFSVILAFMYWNHSKIFQQRIKYSTQVEILELSSIKSNNLINFVYYLDFIVKQNATFKSVNYNDTKHYQDQISYIKTLYNILKQYPSLRMQQQFNTTQQYDNINNNNESNINTNTNSLLLFKTMIVSIDWLLTDFMSNDIINSVEQIVHLEENAQKIQEIIGYYQLLILDDQHRFSQLTLNQLIMTICIMTITIVVGIALLILDLRIQKQNNVLNLLLLGLDPTELSSYIEDCFNFLQLTYPTNQSSISAPFLYSPSNSDNNQQSRMITQMSLIQNSSVTHNIQIPNNNYRLQTDTDQILIPAQFQQAKCKISKVFMVILIIFIISIQGIFIGSYFFSQSNQIPIKKMMESASALKSQHAVYISIHLELLGSITNTHQLSKLNSKINNYNTKVNKQLQLYTSQIFTSSQFDKYKEMKNSLDFARMCDYQQCTEFGSMLNTSYSSSTLNALGYITQISKYLSDKNNSSNLGIQQLILDHHLQCLVYVSQYLCKLFTKVLGELMSSIKMYLKYLNRLQSILYNIMIGQWVIMLIMVTWMSYKLWSTRTKGCKILGLFNSKLYTSGI